MITSSKNYTVFPGFTVADSPHEAIEILKKKHVKNIVITGGSKLNSSFAKEGLIDEIILNIEPVVIGEGIPLFGPQLFDLKLKLLNIEQTKNKTLVVRYEVI